MSKWEKDFYGKKPINPSQRIFRVTKFEYLLESLRNNKSRFSSPWAWEAIDPLDAIFIRTKLNDKKLGLIGQTYEYDYFCQCWQTKGDYGYIWQEFSRPDENGQFVSVMIESNLNDIMESIYVEDYARIFGGEAFYCSEKDLVDPNLLYRIEDDGSFLFAASGRGLKNTLFFKCDYYINENELRLCIIDENLGKKVKADVESGKKGKEIAGLDYLKKKPYQRLVHRVIVDPRMIDEKYNEIKEVLKGFGINNVERSVIKTADVKPLGPKPQLPNRLIYNVKFG